MSDEQDITEETLNQELCDWCAEPLTVEKNMTLCRHCNRVVRVKHTSIVTDTDIALLIQSATPTMNFHNAEACAKMIMDNFEGKVLLRDRSMDSIMELFNGMLRNLSTEEFTHD
jgi:hypothetical protein